MVHESQLPRSCDRCHALKERCQWMAGSTKCRRCARLRQACQSKRPLKRPGRRPKPCSPLPERDSTSVSSSSCTSESSIESLDRRASPLSHRLSVLGHVSPDMIRCLERVVRQDDLVEQFILGPSFVEMHRETIVSHLLNARATVQDAFMACILLRGDGPSSPPDELQLMDGYRRASSAISTLRSLKVTDAQEISSCLMLGVAILTFVLRLGASDALAICDQTLSLIKPVYDLDAGGNGEHPGELGLLSCVVLIEATECLLLTRPSTLRFRPLAEPCCVDRYVGLCTTLLPFFHDLCQLNSAMLLGSREDGGATADMAESLDVLELDIRNWRPSVPDGFAARHTPNEVAHIICQTQVMPMAVLLIVHRLRHPFGTEEGVGSVLATSILAQLDTTLLVTGSAPPCVDVPLIAACLELQDEDEWARWVRHMSSVGEWSSSFHERIERVLAAAWEARRQCTSLYWYHLGGLITPEL